MKPHDPYWETLANQTARDFCPNIYACANCGKPYVKGFCCRYCETVSPEQLDKPCKVCGRVDGNHWYDNKHP